MAYYIIVAHDLFSSLLNRFKVYFLIFTASWQTQCHISHCRNQSQEMQMAARRIRSQSEKQSWPKIALDIAAVEAKMKSFLTCPWKEIFGPTSASRVAHFILARLKGYLNYHWSELFHMKIRYIVWHVWVNYFMGW